MIYVSIEDILIEKEHLLSREQLITIDNVEGSLKEAFLKVLSENTGVIIKSADLKNKYIERLRSNGADIEKLVHKLNSDLNYVQILKNLTGSNINNKTHLLRDKHVNWIYGKGKEGSIYEIVAKKENSTDLPDDFHSSRKHGNNYFVSYNETLENDSFLNKELNKLLLVVKKPSVEEEELTLRVNAKIRNSKLQKIFRHNLIVRDKCNCAIKGCNITDKNLLISSHIIPVAEILKDSNIVKTEKIKMIVNPSNGLLLCPNHDKLLDKKYITFDKNGVIIFHKPISSKEQKSLNISSKTMLSEFRVKKDIDMHKYFSLLRDTYI